MKLVGLLGGTSWPSTIEYYRLLNRMAAEAFGGHHSANLVVRSIDYHEIKSRYHHAWDEIAQILKAEIEAFAKMEPECILICNNTLHQAYDAIAKDLSITMPVFHMVDITARYLHAKALTHVLLLGTQYTMENGYYKAKLEQAGITVTIPTEQERVAIQAMQNRLAKGDAELPGKAQEIIDFFTEICDKYHALDAAILACTELPLAAKQENTSLQLINPMELQCQAAFHYATYPTPGGSAHAAHIFER